MGEKGSAGLWDMRRLLSWKGDGVTGEVEGSLESGNIEVCERFCRQKGGFVRTECWDNGTFHLPKGKRSTNCLQ